MDSDPSGLHVLLFPLMAQGHTLPTIDLAKLFAARGVKATIITTPANAPLFEPSIARANLSGYQNPIQLYLIPFPSGTGLPEGCENMSSLPGPLNSNFFKALGLLREPFDRAVRDILPDCIVAGLFLAWIHDIAYDLNIPSLDFHGSNIFSKCAANSIERHKVLESQNEEVDSLVIPGLPDRIEMARAMIPDFKKIAPFISDLLDQRKRSEAKSYGVIFNSFYELEPGYIECYRNVIGRRAWHVGPMLLCNKDAIDKSRRGYTTSTVDGVSCLDWLDEKSPGSVIYVCFGSASSFTGDQIRELAFGLEASNRPFVWVVGTRDEESIPGGFEERVEGKGLIIRGWAPQMLILNHVAVGGFLTHCGWNSTLEGISAGLPLITWPLFAEQSFNERLIIDVLKIGIAVGVKEFTSIPEDRTMVKAATIENAVDKLMGEDEEADERRRRGKALGELAKRAMEEGGSSYNDMSKLIQELKEMRGRKI